MRFRTIAKKHGLTPLEASLLFVYEHPRIAHIVFGVEKPSQLREGLAVVEHASRKSHAAFAQEVRNSFKTIESSVVDPSRWSNKT